MDEPVPEKEEEVMTARYGVSNSNPSGTLSSSGQTIEIYDLLHP
jgi:hypothetical protein